MIGAGGGAVGAAMATAAKTAENTRVKASTPLSMVTEWTFSEKPQLA